MKKRITVVALCLGMLVGCQKAETVQETAKVETTVVESEVESTVQETEAETEEVTQEVAEIEAPTLSESQKKAVEESVSKEVETTAEQSEESIEPVDDADPFEKYTFISKGKEFSLATDSAEFVQWASGWSTEHPELKGWFIDNNNPGECCSYRDTTRNDGPYRYYLVGYDTRAAEYVGADYRDNYKDERPDLGRSQSGVYVGQIITIDELKALGYEEVLSDIWEYGTYWFKGEGVFNGIEGAGELVCTLSGDPDDDMVKRVTAVGVFGTKRGE